jgi:hypothetical protein
LVKTGDGGLAAMATGMALKIMHRTRTCGQRQYYLRYLAEYAALTGLKG